jgi:hypothetical protein
MRAAGVRGLLIYCADYHSIRGDLDLRLSDIEGQFVCKACGNRGAEVRAEFRLG